MNSLINEIVRHIFKGFNIISQSSFVGGSLIHNSYKLSEQVKFEEDGQIYTKPIYGCQILFKDQSLKVLLSFLSANASQPEYAMIIHLDNSPMYGIHLSGEDNGTLIYSVDGKSWTSCDTYVAATFLAAMEYIKIMGANWFACTSYQEEYQALLSLIEFNNLQEEEDER